MQLWAAIVSNSMYSISNLQIIHCSFIKKHMLQAIHCNTLQYNAVQYNVLQCNAISRPAMATTKNRSHTTDIEVTPNYLKYENFHAENFQRN